MHNSISGRLKMPGAVVADSSRAVNQLCMMIRVGVVSQIATQMGLERTLTQRHMPMLMHATHSHRNKCDRNQ